MRPKVGKDNIWSFEKIKYCWFLMYVDIRIFCVLINSDEEKMFYHHWSVRAECVECECVCFYSMNIHYFRPVWSLDVAEMKMRVLEDLRIHTSTLHRMHFSSKLKSMSYEASMEDVRLCRVIMSKWYFMSCLRYDCLDQNMSCACQL